MTTLPLNEVKTRFSAIADEVAATHDRVVVTRNGKPHVMVIAVDDFESLQMTREILATPGALQDIQQGRMTSRRGVTTRPPMCGRPWRPAVGTRMAPRERPLRGETVARAGPRTGGRTAP